MVEALGVGLPGNAAFPAVDARRNVIARMAGRRIVEMVEEDLKLSKILTRAAFENAIRVNAAIGGSTNAVIHLIAIARPHRGEARPRGLGRIRPRRAHAREPDAERQVPDGGLLLRGRPAGGDPRAGRGGAAEQGRAHGERPVDLGQQQGGAQRRPRRDHAVRKPFKREHRHRRAARQPLPRRRDHQAVGGDAEAHEAQGPGGGVRGHRGFPRAHRRSEARHRRDLRDGAEELRAEGLSGHGGGRQHAAAAKLLKRA